MATFNFHTAIYDAKYTIEDEIAEGEKVVVALGLT